jgi:hypothetical protein
MRKGRCTYRCSSLSVRPVFWLAFFFRPLVVLSLAVLTLVLLGPAARAQNIFNCSSFTTTGTCGVGSGQPFGPYGYTVSDGVMDFVQVGATHNGNAFWYQTAVNVQGFTSTFTFVPNGFNLAFVLNNCNQYGCGSGKGPTYAAGAGCEGGFYQAFDGPPYPNNVFAVMLDSYSPLTNGANFTYSSTQIYQTNQSPCIPNDLGPDYYPTNKVSTSPVNLTTGSSPSTTGHTYSATVTYSGTTLTLSMYDVTAGGSCPGATCFTQSWPVYIPSIVGGTTAYVGLTSGIGETTTLPLYVDSFSYTVNSSSGPPTATLANMYADAGGTATTANPLYSPAPDRYSGTQAVTLTSSTANSYICYVLAATPPALTPQTKNDGTCAQGTLYTGPITISSSQTLYSMASTPFLSPPSALTIGAYTIGGAPAASTPTFSPVAGTYTSTQNVTISTSSSGAVICYNTTGSPATNSSAGCTTGTLYSGPVTVSSNETLYAVAGGAEYGDSPVGSASYVIQNVAQNSVATPTFSPAAGTYSSPQSIAISDATSGAAIYYTTDGTTPTTSSPVYNGPITDELDGDAQSHRGSHGRQQQHDRVGGLHHYSATFLYAYSFADLAHRHGQRTRDSDAYSNAGERVRLHRELCVLRAADRGHMRLQPGDRDTLGFAGNDPTHDLQQCAIFFLAAGIPTISPLDSAGDDGLPVRMEKSARLASLAAAGGNWHRPGACLRLLAD